MYENHICELRINICDSRSVLSIKAVEKETRKKIHQLLKFFKYLT